MPKKPRPISTKKRTSQGYRVSVLKRLGRLARYSLRAEVEAFMVSDYFATAMLGMTPYDRAVTLTTACRYAVALDAFRDVPMRRDAKKTPRLRWTPEARAKVRAVVARYGMRRGLDREIARELRVPLMAAAVARYREVGRLRAPQSHRKPRARGTHGGKAA